MADETFQVRFVGDGPLRGVFAVCNGALETRGYVGNPKVALDGGVKSGVGAGQLQVVRLKNLPGEEELSPYSSVVEITSGEIAEDINYYATSEQRERRSPRACLLLDGMEPQLDFDVKHPAFKCDCGIDRVYRVLALLPRDEIQDILDQNDKIEARCEFCSRLYSLGKDEIAAHFARVDVEDE
ncbi:Hsp33 protein [Aureococcus anophagefferens]|nr:Hsp33 protein [Aureococcus anophagefferens]